MFLTKDELFMSKELKIDTSDLELKISKIKSNIDKKNVFLFISESIKAIRSNTATHYEETIAEIRIKYNYRRLLEHLEDNDARLILDKLRHAFCSYARGGLLQLYKNQERENWYPKIILDEELTPNDISKLPDEVLLYRGTSFLEFTSKEYGQSWTTSHDEAKEFACKHYRHQDWFNIKDQVILITRYSKKNIYYYSEQSQDEFEAIINTKKLKTVEICCFCSNLS